MFRSSLPCERMGSVEELPRRETTRFYKPTWLSNQMPQIHPEKPSVRRVIEYGVCPISLHTMRDPVFPHGCGHSFERILLQTWMQSGNHFCPVCRASFVSDLLTPNHEMRGLLEQLREEETTSRPSQEHHFTKPIQDMEPTVDRNALERAMREMPDDFGMCLGDLNGALEHLCSILSSTEQDSPDSFGVRNLSEQCWSGPKGDMRR